MTKGSCLFVFISIVALGSCNHPLDTGAPLSQHDTVAVLQTALNDPRLVADAALYLPGQALRLMKNKVVKPDYSLTFNRQAVQLIMINEEGPDVREAYPGQFIISFPLFKAVDKDTVVVSMIVHSGNSTDLYKIARNHDNGWHIVSDQRGKF